MIVKHNTIAVKKRYYTLKGKEWHTKIKKTKEVLSIMKNCKYKLNESNGITLVSLVVTIIALMILARHKYCNNIRK